jgi:RecA-family ATPase
MTGATDKSFAEGLSSWASLMATVPQGEARWLVFQQAAKEIAGYTRKGLTKSDAVDWLNSTAEAHGFIEEHTVDGIQAEIAFAFEQLDRDSDVVPDPVGDDGDPGPDPDPKSNGHANGHDKAPPPPLTALEVIDAAQFDGLAVLVRRWLCKDRVPMRNVSLLQGDGATGKTTIALQLAVRVAMGLSDWLGAVIDEPGTVLFFTAEEEQSEIHFRLDQILQAYDGLAFKDLRGRLHLRCDAGEDCVLAAPDRTGMLKETRVYERLVLTIAAIRPKLVVLESAADLFAGNESDRAQVRHFIRMLRKIAIDFDCAVLLLGHPSVAGMASGSGSSGSTGWSNSVRSRMYFTRDEDKDASEGTRILKVMKSNYGPEGERIQVFYERGIYKMVKMLGSLETAVANQKCDEVFVILLNKFAAQGRDLSEKPSTIYAPALFAKEKLAKDAKLSKEALGEAMRRLFESERIRIKVTGPDSKQRRRIVEVTEADRQAMAAFARGEEEPELDLMATTNKSQHSTQGRKGN